jgi:hypothetical protein
VTREQQFEQRLADWLEDGPLDAPDRVIDAAVARARAHPRRRSPLAGLWRTVMTRMQPTPFPSPARRTRITAFASVAVVAVVALAVVGGGALLLNRGPANQPAAAPAVTVSPAPTPPATPAPAASSDQALVADLAAMASNPYDPARVAALYAPNAVIHETTANQTQRGLDEIGARMRYFDDQKFEAVVTSAPIRQDNFVAVFSKYGTRGDLSGRALVVYELKDGKVLNQWVYDAASLAATQSPPANTDEALVADLAAVVSSPYEAAKVTALYAPNAVMRELTEANVTSTGLDEIGARIRYFNTQDFEVVVTSAVIRQDNFVAAFHKYGTRGDLSGRALTVYELKDGKVLNQWVYPAP